MPVKDQAHQTQVLSKVPGFIAIGILSSQSDQIFSTTVQVT